VTQGAQRVTTAPSATEGSTLRLAVVGKGGVGKTIVCATIARTLARRGRRVLVLDHDSSPGLSTSLGLQGADEPLLNAAMERVEGRRYRFVEGLDAVGAAQRFAIDGPDGIRVLQVGKSTIAGPDAVEPAVNAFYTIVSRLEHAPEFGGWAIVGDIPAGGRQPGCGWTPYATHFLLVVEATWQSMLTARRIKRLANIIRPDGRVSLLVSKATGPADVERISEFLDMQAIGVVPLDDGVRSAERVGAPVFDHPPAAAAVAAITRIAEQLDAEHEAAPAPA
jgi:CO dehydrogenase maturation factor